MWTAPNNKDENYDASEDNDDNYETIPWWHILYVEFPLSVCCIHHGGVRANTFAPREVVYWAYIGYRFWELIFGIYWGYIFECILGYIIECIFSGYILAIEV